MSLTIRAEHAKLYSLLLRGPQLCISFASSYRITPKPVMMTWEATWRCTERCVGCNRPNEANPREELSTKDALHLMDESHALGVRIVVFSGGDPLVRRDVPDIALHARELGMVTVVCTPALLIRDNNIDLMLKCFDVFDISLDSLHPEVHDHLRGRRYALRRTLEAIELLAREKSPRHGLVITSRVMDATFDEMGEINKRLSALGAVTAMQPLHQDLYGARTDDTYEWATKRRAEWKDLIDAYQWYDLFSKLALERFHRLIPAFSSSPKNLPKYRCFAGTYSFIIDPGGTLVACDPLRQVAGNVRDRPLSEIWSSMRDLRRGISSKTRPCNCWLLCSTPPSLFLSRCIGWWPFDTLPRSARN